MRLQDSGRQGEEQAKLPAIEQARLEVARIFKSVFGLLLFCALVPPAFGDGLTAGKIVWWGDGGGSLKEIRSTQTNGVIERENEIASDVIAIAARCGNGLGVRKDGTVFTFGIGWFGLTNVPAGLSNVVSVGVEDDSCWAIKRDGTAAIWGDGAGKAGMVRGLSNVVSLAAAGNRNYLALETDGTVLEFRSGTPNPAIQPVKVGGQALANVVALASVPRHPLVVKKDGRVYPFDSVEPIQVGGEVLSNVQSLAYGEGQFVGLKRNGTVVAWGSNLYGEINVPADLTNVVAIAADEHLSLALKRDGTVAAWGGNYFGQASVPAGLSNVIAIAAGCQFSLALTTASAPASVYIIPHGQLEIMARDADLIFKGQVVSDQAKANASFPDWAKPHTTEFKVISVLKGNLDTDTLAFWHITGRPMAWSGPSPPAWHSFAIGQTYLIYADKIGKPESLYTVPPDAASRPNEFRQLYGGGVMRTLDVRLLPGLGFKEAHWVELNLLLNDPNPTNQLYAIDELDQMSLAGRRDDGWQRSDDFKRPSVLSALLALVTNSNETVANRAISCFAVEAKSGVVAEPFAQTLIRVANDGPTSSRRLNAIGSLSGRHFAAISNSLAQLLQSPDENVRSESVELLELFPGEFSEQALRKAAGDDSPRVRSCVANVIGSGRMENLLPTLVKLFADPVGLASPLSPLTTDEVQAGGRADSRGDVHTCSGYALLNFDMTQVGVILKANISDKAFRLSFMKKLAENGVEPDFQALAVALKNHTARSEQEAVKNGFHWGLSYWLTGNYGWAWDTLFSHVSGQTRAALADPKMVPLLDALQIADDPGDARTRSLYGFFLDKGMIERAIVLRRGIIRRTEDKAILKESFGFPALLKLFDAIDEKHSFKPGLGILTNDPSPRG